MYMHKNTLITGQWRGLERFFFYYSGMVGGGWLLALTVPLGAVGLEVVRVVKTTCIQYLYIIIRNLYFVELFSKKQQDDPASSTSFSGGASYF